MSVSKFETRKSEIRFRTSDPHRMLNKFIAKRVIKKWKESLNDTSSGEAVEIERSELLFERGTYVDQDVLSSILFFQQDGSITEDIELSNQKRLAFTWNNSSLLPYKAIVKIEDKRKTFLLYATSVANALVILTDYIELNFSGGFTISDIKELDYCVILIDSLKSASNRRYEIDTAYLKNEISLEEYTEATCNGIQNDNNDAEDSENDRGKDTKRFYQIGAHIVLHHDKEGDEEEYGTFIVQTVSAVRANLLIEKYLRDKQEQRYQESLKNPDKTYEKKEIHSFIEESKTIPVGYFIPKGFSDTYNDIENDH